MSYRGNIERPHPRSMGPEHPRRASRGVVSAVGVPRADDASMRWQLSPPTPSTADAPGRDDVADTAIDVHVRDILDYFEKCPRCGYAAQASMTTRTFGNGRVEQAIHVACGSPCGWQNGPQSPDRQTPSTTFR